MGVHDKLEQLKNEKQLLTHLIATEKKTYDVNKIILKGIEKTVKVQKTKVNKSYKEWVILRKRLLKIESKIKSFNSQVRQYNKEHPLKIFDKEYK